MTRTSTLYPSTIVDKFCVLVKQAKNYTLNNLEGVDRSVNRFEIDLIDGRGIGFWKPKRFFGLHKAA